MVGGGVQGITTRVIQLGAKLVFRAGVSDFTKLIARLQKTPMALRNCRRRAASSKDCARRSASPADAILHAPHEVLLPLATLAECIQRRESLGGGRLRASTATSVPG